MHKADAQLKRTPAGIPVSLRPFFQEYQLEDLDPERSAFTVIERTLAWGEVPELRWLFGQYGEEGESYTGHLLVNWYPPLVYY